MNLKNRKMHGVNVKASVSDGTRGDCHICKGRGSGLTIMLRSPEIGKRHVCYTCFLQYIIGDVIDRHKKVVLPIGESEQAVEPKTVRVRDIEVNDQAQGKSVQKKAVRAKK